MTKASFSNINAATEKVFGFTKGELIGHNVNALMPEPYRSRHDGYLRHHLETGERKIIGIGRQVMARRKSGAIFPAHLSVSAFEDEGRRYFTGIIHDLSDQPGSDVLREQTLLHAIFNQLPDALLIVDPAGKITLCSPAVTRVFGYTPEELIGRTTGFLCENSGGARAHRSGQAALAGSRGARTADHPLSPEIR